MTKYSENCPKIVKMIDIKYFSLCEWVERDLMTLERIDTSKNMSDHFTKQLATTLFNRHNDYIAVYRQSILLLTNTYMGNLGRRLTPRPLFLFHFLQQLKMLP